MIETPPQVPGTAGAPRRRRGQRRRPWAATVGTGLAVAVAGGLLHTALTWHGGTPATTSAGTGAAAAGSTDTSSDAASAGSTGASSASATAGSTAQGGASGTDSSDAVDAGGSSVGTPTGTAGTAAALAAAAPLPVGDLPGWRQVFSDDFTSDVPEGGWARSAYADRWLAYDGFPDTHGVGRYSEDALSTSDGLLQMRWHTQDGVPLVTGVVPLVDGAWGGHVGGRYSVRFRADASAGYVAALLLWPDSNTWDDGEIDFAEGDVDGGINAYHHCPGDAEKSCGTANTAARFSDWHVATVEWTSTGVTYLLDGYVVQRAKEVPTTPMHLVLQGFVRPGWDAATDARVQVDWVSVWYPEGS